MNYNIKELQEYNARRQFACNELSITTNQYNHLRRLSLELTKIDTQNCNGEINEDEYDKDFIKIEDKIQLILNKHNLRWYHQGDPRGLSLYVSKTPIDGTNYNRGQGIL